MRANFVLSEVATGLWRNVTMTVAMIITTAISLGLLGAAGLVLVQVDKMKEYFYYQVEVSIFLEQEVTAEQRTALETKLGTDPMVSASLYESKEQAYERFREQFQDSPDLIDSVRPEALPEAFRVKLTDPEQVDVISERYGAEAGVEEVADQQRVVKPLFDVLGKFQNAALIVAAVQGVAALLLISNTVQVAAYSRRREVSIMRLVGASGWYVQLPFVLEAAVAGLIGALVAWISLAAAKLFVVDGILDSALSGVIPTWSWTWVLATGPLLGGIAVLLAAVTGWLTLRFYVKV